jgi:hypothetical protein
MLKAKDKGGVPTIKPIAKAEGRDGKQYRADMTEFLGTEDKIMQSEIGLK